MLKNYVTEEALPSADLNQLVKGAGFKFDLNAGEAINGATLPVPVYQDTTDGELYACDANDAAKLNFLGFAISNSTNGNPITLQTEGILGGFTGLTRGVKYYVQDTAGTIGVTPMGFMVKVGRAISTTEILIEKETRTLSRALIASDVLIMSADTTRSFGPGTGAIGKSIRLINIPGVIRVEFDMRYVSGDGISAAWISVNGTQSGTARNNSGKISTFQTYTEDISVSAAQIGTTGALVQLYVSTSSGNTLEVRNFRVYFSETYTDNSIAVVTD